MNYSIHQILKVKANVGVPIPDYFQVEKSLRDPDLTVLSRKNLNFKRSTNNKILRGNYYFWREKNKLFVDYCFMNAKLSIENLSSRTKIECTHSLKRFCTEENWQKFIIAILSIKLIQKGYTFVHAGCLSYNREGILIAGMQDTGKTSTILSLVDGKEFKFLSDDLVIVGENNVAYAYPKEVRVSPRTLKGKIVPCTIREKFLKSRLLSTFIERFAKKDITRLVKVPDRYIVDKCHVKKIFVLGGYGKEKVIKMDKNEAFNIVSTLSLQTPNLLETYLDMYYHLFNTNIVGLLEKKNRIIKKNVMAANCFKVTAPDLESYSRTIKEAVKSCS